MSKLCVGMVGAGGISRPHLDGWKALSKSVDLEVLVFSEEGAPELVAEFEFGRVAATFAEILERASIVDIVTPTYTHADLACAALRAGLDVICEKPLALSSTDAQAVVDLANELGRHLYPAHVVRFFPQYVAAKTAVDSGAIGDLAVTRFQRVGSFPDWSDWFADEALSGGVILDLMVHDLDVARWIGGPITQVYATMIRRDEGSLPQALCQAVLTHSSGAVSYANAVWGAPGLTFNTSFHLSGSQGEVAYDSQKDATVTFDLGENSLETTGVNLPALETIESPYLTELRAFLGAIQGGDEPAVTGVDGVEAIRLAEAVRLSAQTGMAVDPTTMTVVENVKGDAQ